MLEPGFVQMKRGGEVKDRFAVLNRGDPSTGEAAAVAWSIDEVDDRCRKITGAQKIAVHRVRFARRIDRASCRNERLREHLSAKNPPGAQVSIEPAIDVDFERLEIEQLQQVSDDGHRSAVRAVAVTDGRITRTPKAMGASDVLECLGMSGKCLSSGYRGTELSSNDIENHDRRRQVLPVSRRSLNGAHDVHSGGDLTEGGEALAVGVARAPEVEGGLRADADEEC